MSSKFFHYANEVANISETPGQTITAYNSFYEITHVVIVLKQDCSVQ